MVTFEHARRELLALTNARKGLLAYIQYTTPGYKLSAFSEGVCVAIDKFIDDVNAGKRPILVLQAPPQHGKTEIASRKLPPYILGRLPNLRIAAASYGDDLAGTIAQDVRRNIFSDAHQRVFSATESKKKWAVNRMSEFDAPGGTGSYLGVGIGGGLTGKPVDIGIIDDPVKNEKEALSETTKLNHWNWYQSVFTTRLSENSGQVIMATSWAQDDLVGRILEYFRGDPRLTHLRFPAINLPDETGYNQDIPEGPLVPELHSLKKLYETKALFSAYWWAAMYQQNPQALGGNTFLTHCQQFYGHDLPKKFDKVISSWDCAFKGTESSDFVVGQVWGKLGANVYLLDQVRERMSFTQTVAAIERQRLKWPAIRAVLIEDKANGPAVIDTLRPRVPGLIPVEPDGDKVARAHAITSYWEGLNVFLPNEGLPGMAWIKNFLSELFIFPAGANDDQVDAFTQALRYLYPVKGKMRIGAKALARAKKRM